MQILQNKKVIVLIVLCLIGIFAYFVFFKSADENQTVNPDTLVGADILSLVQSLEKVSIDPNFFVAPSFIQLKDFTTVVVPEEQGRSNPFALYSGKQTVVTKPR